MRVPGQERLSRWRRRTGAVNWLSVAEMALMAGVALQVARLVWAVMTPVGPAGPWEGRRAEILAPAAREALFASFDPFFRADGPKAGNVVVTSLALTVYGIRLNEGTGLGAAIIATPDGIQNSFAVGDEIMPGVVLKAVAFDHVTIDRGGAEEQVFIDQSTPAPEAAPGEGAGAAPAPGEGNVARVPPASMPLPPQSPIGSLTPDVLKHDVGFAPRTQNGRVTGLVLQSKGPGFAAAGFLPGDIVTQVNGRAIGSAGDLAVLQNQITPRARLSLMVERGATVVPVALMLQGQ